MQPINKYSFSLSLTIIITLDLQVFIILWEGGLGGFLEVVLDLSLPLWVHLHLGWEQGRHGNEFQVRITNQLTGQPQEGLLEVVI